MEKQKTVEELQAEIDTLTSQLKAAKARRPIVDRDELPESFRFIYDYAVDYVLWREGDTDRRCNDIQQHMFEEVVESIYGSGIWGYLNSL